MSSLANAVASCTLTKLAERFGDHFVQWRVTIRTLATKEAESPLASISALLFIIRSMT